jgi:hypothetical protein
MKSEMPSKQVTELLLQSLEHERGGVQVYEAALKCVLNEDLKGEWAKYLSQTRHHVDVLTNICTQLGISPDTPSPGAEILRNLGEALVDAMETASNGEPEAAQLVACECVVIAETKDHLDWELIGKCSEQLLKGESARMLRDAYEEIEDQEDEHLYHSKGWCRELWLESLGMKAVLPPPEEVKQVKSAIGAARAEMESERTR